MTAVVPLNIEHHGTWAELLAVSYGVATLSPDPSTQNGAFLAVPSTDMFGKVSLGTAIRNTFACNTFADGVEQTAERWERPAKYPLVVHAERNAIYHAARHGIEAKGMALVAAWASCAECAQAVIQAGVKYLVRHAPDWVPDAAHWKESVSLGDTMFAEAGVEIIEVTRKLDAPEVRRNGAVWQP